MKRAIVAFCLLLLSCFGCSGRATIPPVNCQRPSLPLRVQVVDISTDAWDRAAREWGSALERSAFVRVSEGPVDARVSIAPTRSPQHVSETGGHCGVTGKWEQTLRLRDPGLDSIALHYYLMHEQGHLLGLKDATNPQSIMYPQISPSLMGGEPGPDPEGPVDVYPWIFPRDAEAVLRAHGI